MKYEVLKSFRDRHDEKKSYGKGGKYPRDGYEPTDEWIKKLIGLGFLKSNEEDSIEVGSVDENNTNDEIRAHLDSLGIEYNKRDTKSDLLALLGD